MLEGEAETLTRKAVELALAGEMTALRLCLERILPPRKDAPIILDLPTMTTAGDIMQIQSTILQAVGTGNITPQEATALCAIAENVRKTIETVEIERRILALETSQSPKQGAA